MALHFQLMTGSRIRGFGKPVVKAAERGLTGVYREGKPYGPDMSAVRECLPFRFRKAFDRAGGTWWFISGEEERASYVTLRDRRGKYLATIYANAVDL
jgi:hypothetical protein